ncbi:sulfatase-like hydrolase/transferase [Lentisphaera profundi]|uniref:Sulfatase-like hydrolase/transferase n=1 Tax=Lentisphaera profundi TaxID=1658616 RepID=A0ABY7VMH0_9BACT|nr:sulfatase-like hydrolase/transferase [Lentisphaera profundi]WDE95210.1 sulfatase-like hydrolase/transferase [Lentisphaera profundi]
MKILLLLTLYFFAFTHVYAERPNIIMIVGDDIGFSDIGAYGSEISTPNLDKLADKGMRFRQFNNMSKCNPTRSSLMTGLYTEQPGAYCFVQKMREAGYHTMFAGKQHLDPWVPKKVFAKNSFDRWFESPFSAFMIKKDGGYPQYNRDDRRALFELNGTMLDVTELETTQPFHKTDATSDYALKFLDEAKTLDKPFFMYVAYHAAHFPLHATPKDIAKYRDVYREGWDEIRKQRFAKQQRLGIVKNQTRLSEVSRNINQTRQPSKEDFLEKRKQSMYHRPWKDLTELERDDLSLEMAVFAAMVDRMDQNIGRVIDKLEEMGVRENTLILFFSDNGSCPYDFNRSYEYPPGVPEGYRSLSAAWANVGNTPFRYYKQYGHRGGMSTHLIANWPHEIKAGIFSDRLSHVIDLAPTMMDLARIDKKQYQDLPGLSLVKEFKSEPSPQHEFIFGGYEGFYAYQEGDWKIIQVNSEVDKWQLYNIKNDPTEIENLASKFPQRVQDLLINMKQRQELPEIL